MENHSEVERLAQLKRLRERNEDNKSKEEQSVSTHTAPSSEGHSQHSLYPSLQRGQTISHGEQSYTIQDLLYKTEQRQTYLAEQNGQAVTLKVVTLPHRSVADEVERLQNRLMQVNAVLDRECRVFALNSLQYAVASTYLEGRDLKQELEQRNRAYTEKETIDFLIQMLEGDLATLHGKKSAESNAWTHGDIKPRNIIRTEEGTYKLIDFGNVHRNDAERTLTLRDMEGSWNYRRSWKSTYEKEDDYFALARVGYFLLTGQDPAMLLNGTDKMQQRVDEEQFRELPVRKELQEILLRMQGYGKQYKGIEGMVEELQELDKEKTEQKQTVGVRKKFQKDTEGNYITICFAALLSAATIATISLISYHESISSSSPPAQVGTIQPEQTPESCSVRMGRGIYEDKDCNGIADESFGNKVKGVYGTVVDFWKTNRREAIDAKTNLLIEKESELRYRRNIRGEQAGQRSFSEKFLDSIENFLEGNRMKVINEEIVRLRKERKEYE